MIRRLSSRWRRWGLWAAAALAVPIAIALAVVAVDLLRTPGEITRDDTRFQTAPMRQRGLWDVGFLPKDLSERVLGLEDDVVYRRLVGLYLRVEPGKVDYSGFPELPWPEIWPPSRPPVGELPGMATGPKIRRAVSRFRFASSFEGSSSIAFENADAAR